MTALTVILAAVALPLGVVVGWWLRRGHIEIADGRLGAVEFELELERGKCLTLVDRVRALSEDGHQDCMPAAEWNRYEDQLAAARTEIHRLGGHWPPPNRQPPEVKPGPTRQTVADRIKQSTRRPA